MIRDVRIEMQCFLTYLRPVTLNLNILKMIFALPKIEDRALEGQGGRNLAPGVNHLMEMDAVPQ